MSELVRRVSFKRNRAWVDWEGMVLIDERGKRDSWIGRNFAYKPVVIKDEEFLLGKLMNVRVVEAFQTYLEAKIKS